MWALKLLVPEQLFPAFKILFLQVILVRWILGYSITTTCRIFAASLILLNISCSLSFSCLDICRSLVLHLHFWSSNFHLWVFYRASFFLVIFFFYGTFLNKSAALPPGSLCPLRLGKVVTWQHCILLLYAVPCTSGLLVGSSILDPTSCVLGSYIGVKGLLSLALFCSLILYASLNVQCRLPDLLFLFIVILLCHSPALFLEVHWLLASSLSWHHISLLYLLVFFPCF